MLEIRVAVAKVGRTSAAASSDTLEMVERPGGGFSFVLVDGKGTGRGAKTLSNMLAARAIALLKDGARDGNVARAVHDYLYTYRMGQAAATLNILSVDFVTGIMRMMRNNPAPFFVLTPYGMQMYSEESTPIGLYASVTPCMTDLPTEAYTYVVMFTDGLLLAGKRYHEDMELSNYLAGWPVTEGHDPERLTEGLLARALTVEHGEPEDDMSIITLAVLPVDASEPHPAAQRVRRMHVRFPFEKA